MDLDMKVLDITGGQLESEGYETNGFGLLYFKDDIFADAHGILQDILYNPPQYDYSWSVEFVMDHEADIHPDVYQAWVAAGGDREVLQTVAKLPELGKWGVGFGGKKNGERAAKIALAASVAMDSPKTQQILWEYPRFGELMNAVSWSMGGCGCGGGGYGKSAGKGGGSKGAGPYGDDGMMGMMGKMAGKGKKGKMMAMMMSMMEGGDWWGGDDGGGWDGGKGDGGGGWGGGKGKGKGKGGAEGTPGLNRLPAETKVWIGNLPKDTESKTLEEHFALSGGTVVGALVMRNGTGCVAYQSAEEAQQAIAVLNNIEFGGQTIQVDVWTSK